jgi:branched-chain amino acid transport system permease protein
VGHPVDQASLYNVMFYILALVVIIIIVMVTRNLEDSKVGRAWAAIREDETAAVRWAFRL